MNSKNRFIFTNLLILFLYFCFFYFSFNDPELMNNILWLGIIYNISWLFIVLFVRDNQFYISTEYGFLRNLLVSMLVFIGVVTSFAIVFKFTFFSPLTYLLPIVVFSYLNLICRKYILQFLKKRGAYLFSNTLLISSGYKSNRLPEFEKAMNQYGYNLVGYLDDKEIMIKNVLNLKIFGNLQDLPKVLRAYTIDEVFIDMSHLDEEKIKSAIKIADSFGVRVKLIPENPLLIARNYKAETIGDLAIFRLRQSPLDNFSKTVIKRMFDFCFAGLIMILLAPVYLFISLIIALDSRGPLFYSPFRKGEAGKTFKCYKFRTMHVCDNPVNGARSTVVDDPRITRVGKFLRKTDLDELPQFFNVIRGDMSVIGPRPHRINLQNDFKKSVSNYMVRSYVKPGITGWAQVNGWRGPTVTEEQKNERVNHDLWYIENWSLWLDLKIIFLTLFGRHHKKAF
ncbi:exopolysaccharide biosynthesis polyprenyl glycosylphosphotransferase [uncultured Eudoraea sp.]|uniref:exopolysaccharide biosynthesis polyprenyl glycosylphosphotransferase n=1 Tax=uncultured Eudoraea sp. TaxID=1035614 RepID=UPI002605CD37|nr:exopolysaccharide biosynthesis polyprenyl glycosylphosphotransferase [uncultured Eudoraea sp.]